MDLSKIDLTAAADRGITTELHNPVTGEPLEDEGGKRVTIKVLGRDSKKWQQIMRKTEQRSAAKYRNKPVPTSVVEDNVREALSECTVSWQNIEYDGVKLVCNKENALMMYTQRNWITEQVIEDAADRSKYDTKLKSS
tara:strand:+ start:1763 stop:2176 length:414 start_codon:yes stop_codon:yes gene_type:complete